MTHFIDPLVARRNATLTTPDDAVKIRIICDLIDKRGFILDLGCGFGSCIIPLSKFGVVIGLDLSKNKLKIAKKTIKHVNLILADAQHLPFRFNVFDAVVAKDVLEHILDHQRAVCEISKVLKCEGEIVVYVPISLEKTRLSLESLIYKTFRYSIDEQVGHVRRYTVNEALSILKMGGFRIAEERYFAHVIISMLSVMVVYLYGRVGSKKEVGTSRFVKAIFRLLEPLCLFEYKMLKNVPGAGLLILSFKN